MTLDGRNLKLGDEGKDVKLLKSELEQLGLLIQVLSQKLDLSFDDKTYEAVKEFQEKNMKKLTSTLVDGRGWNQELGEVDPVTAKLINESVDALALEDPDLPLDEDVLIKESFVVRGQVKNNIGLPKESITIIAYDKDMRTEEELGTTKTDKNGNYEIAYIADRGTKDEKGTADLLVIAYDSNAKELRRSPIIFNAREEEIINLTINDGSVLLSEYEILLNDITPIMQGVLLHELNNDDIYFLAGDTNHPIQRIRLMVESGKRNAETEDALPVYIFYGLFRQDLPTGLNELLNLPLPDLNAAVKRSEERNIIPKVSPEDLYKLRELKIKHLLRQAKDGEKATVGDLIRLANDEEAKVRSYIEQHYLGESKNQDGTDWVAPFTEAEEKRVRLSLDLGTITNYYLPMVDKLLQTTTGSDIRFFAKYQFSNWKEIISPADGSAGTGFPVYTRGNNDEQKANNYATDLTKYFESNYPTNVFSSRLKENIATFSFAEDLQTNLVSFFDKLPEFDFKKQTVSEKYYRENFLDNDKAILTDTDKNTIGTLKGMQRLDRFIPQSEQIATRFELIAPLLKKNIDSATMIASMGLQPFIDLFEGSLSPEIAENVFVKAVKQFDAAVVVGTDLWTINRDNGFTFLNGRTKIGIPSPPAMDADQEIDADPEWRTFFGSLDQCECDHCQSAISPGAYLVDILNFLQSAKKSDVKEVGAFKELKNRRPDIFNTALTCKNTDTTLPYIDLVNEILENAIYNPFEPFTIYANTSWAVVELETDITPLSDGIHNSSSALIAAFLPRILSKQIRITKVETGKKWLIIDSGKMYECSISGTNNIYVSTLCYQTGYTSDVLAAIPEHLNAQAYNILKGAGYPWNLPFNLWNEEAKIYLRQMGMQRYEMMKALFTGTNLWYDDIKMAREYLGITSNEYNIIISTTEQYQYWGFNGSTDSIKDPANPGLFITGVWTTLLSGGVDAFLQQSGLKYMELLDLLDTYFINAKAGDGRSLVITAVDDEENKATCELNRLKIVGATADVFGKMHRFVRLSRKLSWSFRDLDRSITALGAVDINETLIKQIALIEHLRKTFNLPIQIILTWYSDIDTSKYKLNSEGGEKERLSLYEKLFLNKAVSNPALEVFSLNEERTELQTVTEIFFSDITDVASASFVSQLSSALGVSHNDLVLLLERLTDPRLVWTGNFSGSNTTDVLFYEPVVGNWWLGKFVANVLQWNLAGDTLVQNEGPNVGQITDHRFVWTGNFNDGGKSDILIYSPADGNWWLGKFENNTLQWNLAGNTQGQAEGGINNFGHAFEVSLIWTGNFSGDSTTDILFYYPGDGCWWLGKFIDNKIEWSVACNTKGVEEEGQNFGNSPEVSRIWAGNFRGDNTTDILFYYPGDGCWWLGKFINDKIEWNVACNTQGVEEESQDFGQAPDASPIWTGNFSGDSTTDILFYYPGDGCWWLGKFIDNRIEWSVASNTKGVEAEGQNFGNSPEVSRIWAGNFSSDNTTDILFYYPGDGCWWLGKFIDNKIEWSVACNTKGVEEESQNFGNAPDASPIWTGNFTTGNTTDFLAYFPEDGKWWLGKFENNSMQWNLVGTTLGIAEIKFTTPPIPESIFFSSIKNLSLLYRYTSFAKVLKLTIKDLFKVIKLTGIDPFNLKSNLAIGDVIKRTHQFLESFESIKNSGFSIEELDYLLAHQYNDSFNKELEEEKATNFLEAIRIGLKKIDLEYIYDSKTLDQNGALTRSKLELLNWEMAAIDQAMALLNAIHPVVTSKHPPFSVDLQDKPAAVPTSLLNDRIVYETGTKKLTLYGIINQAEKDNLLQPLPGDEVDIKYNTALNELYRQSNIYLQNPLLFETGLTDNPITIPFTDERLFYDTAAKKLRFFGLMRSSRKDTLSAYPGSNDLFKEAVNDLYDQSNAVFRVFEYPVFASAVSKVPGVIFPEGLNNRIYYDSGTKLLNFKGLMTFKEKEMLKSLQTGNEYSEAINDLYKQGYDFSLNAGIENKFLTTNEIDTLFSAEQTPQDRFSIILPQLYSYLRTILSEAFVVQSISQELNLTELTAKELLKKYIHSAVTRSDNSLKTFTKDDFVRSNPLIKITSTSFPDQYKTFVLLNKIGTVINKLEVAYDELPVLFKYSSREDTTVIPSVINMYWLNPDNLPSEATLTAASFADWMNLTKLIGIRNDLPNGKKILLETFAHAFTTSNLRGPIETIWQKYLDVPVNDLVSLFDRFSLLLPVDFLNVEKLYSVFKSLQILKMLGVTAQQAIALVANDDFVEEDTSLIKHAVITKYKLQQWLESSKSLRNALREKQRAALVDYLIHNNKYLHFKDVNDLYAYYLIDVEMGACMITSRIKQAISSVQLFVMRCLMNLESDLRLIPTGNHLYTTSLAEVNDAVAIYGYKLEGITGFVFNAQDMIPGTTKLFRLYTTNNENHFFTTSQAEADNAVAIYQYQIEGVACLVFSSQTPGTTPLFRLYNPISGHHLYTISQSEASNAVVNFGYLSEGITCYVFSSQVSTPLATIPLYRLLKAGQEFGASPASIDIKGWAWRKYYRIWEVNRKIFAMPENWLEPELRDNKSPFYKELESELLQGDITKDTVETAMLNYLGKLEQVARLEIVGMYHEQETATDPAVDILHVFGRTYSVPHIYFYHKLEDNEWSAWEKMEIDIEGDHLIPAVWNRRLYLFWPIFSKKQTEVKPPTGVAATAFTYTEPERWFEIKYAWSEYKNNKWVPKKMSASPFESGHLPKEKLLESNFSFKLNTQSEKLIIACFGPKAFNETTTIPGEKVSSSSENVSDVDQIITKVPLGFKRQYYQGADEGMGYKAYAFKVSIYNNGILETRDITIKHLPSQEIETFSTNADYWIPEKDSEGNLLEDSLQELEISFKHKSNQAYGGVNAFPPFKDGGWVSLDAFTLESTETNDIPVNLTDIVYSSPGSSETTSEKIIYPDMLWIDESEFIGIDIIKSGPSGLFPDQLPFLSETTLQGMMHEASEPNIGLTYDYTIFLNITPGVFKLLPSPQYHSFNINQPIFFQNDLHTYFFQVYVNDPDGWVDHSSDFNIHYYPYNRYIIQSVATHGLEDQYRISFQERTDNTLVFMGYGPTGNVSYKSRPTENFEFSFNGAYSIYNWEIFFHAPFQIACKLSQNQRFEEAQKWFHYIFDPTSGENGGAERFWKFWPFYDTQSKGVETFSDLIKLVDEIQKQEDKLSKNPFNPHVVARLRTSAYMKNVVMKYLDNLIAWGEQLFRQDTMETINEATQLYILAAEILGRRTERIPARAEPEIQTFNALEGKSSNLWNIVVNVENYLFPSGSTSSGNGSPGLGTMSLFCLPKNEKLLAYWDTVADRLFKIRHCMNIEGVERQLSLFESPIDPALLIKAAAAELDIGSILNNLNAPLPCYRFNVMSQKASELCSEVKALGGAMLSALEKRDAEALSLLRSGHESAVLKLIEDVKKQQIEEADASIISLNKSRDESVLRFKHYQRYLGEEDTSIPTFDSKLQMLPYKGNFKLEDESGMKILSYEKQELEQSLIALENQNDASGISQLASILSLIPDIKITAEPQGLGSGLTFGGSFLSHASSAFAESYRAKSASSSHSANKAAKLGGFTLRLQENILQRNLSANQIMQIDKQLISAQIRKAIAEKDLKNHQKQMENAKEVDDYMRDKFTNQQLYDWMVGQISGIYFQSYQLAYDVAKKTERAYRNELGIQSSNFIQFGYWDSLKKGLMSGEKLFHDIKRMEVAYLDQNKREFELSKHISIAMLDPIALLELKQTGSCNIDLPEELFDLDYPGHYFRRIKSVNLSIPCIAGPYTTVNSTLRLLNNSIRINTANGNNGYVHNNTGGVPSDDSRFVENNISFTSIATSSGQGDSGVFELNFRDVRYLPFEGAGAISKWKVELNGKYLDPETKIISDFSQFDFNSISDVIIHLKYTAREDAGEFKKGAIKHLTEFINNMAENAKQPFMRLFSLKSEFPNEWHKFLYTKESDATQLLKFDLNRERFPYQFMGKDIQINQVELFLKFKDAKVPDSAQTYTEAYAEKEPLKISFSGITNDIILSSDDGYMNGIPHAVSDIDSKIPVSWSITVSSDNNSGLAEILTKENHLDSELIEDLFVVCHYFVE